LNTTIPFIFRYSAGTSQTIRRRVLIGDIFRWFYWRKWTIYKMFTGFINFY